MCKICCTVLNYLLTGRLLCISLPMVDLAKHSSVLLSKLHLQGRQWMMVRERRALQGPCSGITSGLHLGETANQNAFIALRMSLVLPQSLDPHQELRMAMGMGLHPRISVGQHDGANL